MSKYAAKHAGLSSDFLGAMIHALRLAEKQLSKSGSSTEKRSVPVRDPKASRRRVSKSSILSSDKRGEKPCVKSSLGKGKSPQKDFPKRKPTSLKNPETPKVSASEKKALRRELSKKTGYRSSNDSRNAIGKVPAGRIVRVSDKIKAKADERKSDIKARSRVERRKALQSTYSFIAKKQGTTSIDFEKIDPADKRMLDKRRREMKKRENASTYAIVLPATECGLLKRGGSVYSHYTWTVDPKGSALKVKRDYGKAIEGLDLTKVGVKNSRVHCGVMTGKFIPQVSSPAAARVTALEIERRNLKAKMELQQVAESPIETLVAKMNNLDRSEYHGIAREGGVVFNEEDKVRITIRTLKKGFAYGRRTLRRTAMFNAVRPIETSRNVMSTEKWTLLEKSEFSRLRNVSKWHSIYGPYPFGKVGDWSAFARAHVRKGKTWREVTDDLEKEVGPICEKYAKDGLPEGVYPKGYNVYDKNFDYLNG